MTQQTSSTASAAYTMILDQSAHLDWDWINTFGRNYWCYADSGESAYGVQDIITQGIQNANNDPNYYYTVCEMAFLRRYLEANPDRVDDIKTLGRSNQFQVISGGITSADNLICAAEGFIRNYLVGQHWLRKTLAIEPKPHCWLPDDFGQGPELPSLLKAIGFVSVAFARLPGIYPPYPNPTLQQDLIDHGVDFDWRAADGSSVFAHWLLQGYSFGNKLRSNESSACAMKTLNSFTQAYNPSGSGTSRSYTAAPMGYMYIPIDDDFSLPIEGLQRYIKAWNESQCVASTSVQVKQGTFDDLVNAALQPQNAWKLRSLQYNGTPVYTGSYASRPELKILQYEAVRALTGAEVFGLLTQPNNEKVKTMLPTEFWRRLDQTWDDLMPSTHHDYVVGTAPDAVYIGEQLPRLQGAAATARSLRAVALTALGNMISTRNDNEYVIVANSLGFERTGVAEINGIESFQIGHGWTTQPSAEGGMLVYAKVPSFGYITSVECGPGPVHSPIIKPTESGQYTYTISNEYLSVTVSARHNWDIISLIDIKNGNTNLLSGPGNVITFYDECKHGSIYQFSSEYRSDGNPMPVMSAAVTAEGAGLGAVVLEHGVLRVRLRTEVSISVASDQTRFVREYELRAGEPFLRMTTTGKAPRNTSVMTSFTFVEEVNTISHGTGYHWTDVQPLSDIGNKPIFRPTHDFLIPRSANGNAMAAIYHSAMSAWGFDSNGVLLGCLLRNTPGSGGHGAKGTDPAAHTQHYALRVPTGLQGPNTGQPLREAQCFHTPLIATRLPSGIRYEGQLTTGNTASLASVISPDDSGAILTVAKPGTYDPETLVLRMYQPTNTAASVQVKLGATPSAATLVTATETQWTSDETVTTDGDVITVPMTGALATVSVEGVGFGRPKSTDTCQCGAK